LSSCAEELIKELKEAIVNLDPDKAREVAEKALKQGIDIKLLINEGIGKAMQRVGELYEQGEYFLPELLLAGEAATEVLKALEPKLKAEVIKPKGVIVIGTVEGDLHDIGKNLVAMVLRANGFEVHDLGRDVPVKEFVKKAIEVDADIVAMSALLTTTMIKMRDVIEELKKAGIRDKVKVLVGGAPVTADFAREIGADGYAEDAIEAVRVAEELVRAKYGGKLRSEF